MLYSDKSKYAKYISKSVYGFGDINDTMSTFKVRWKQQILYKLNSVALVRTRNIPTERPPPVGEVSANFCG